MLRAWRFVTFATSLAAGLLGCASPAGPGRCKIAVVLQSAAEVNPSRTGEALPTTVRFYQLKDVSNLKKASYEDLWTQAEQVLGSDLTETQEVVVFPADEQQQTLAVKDDTVYLAVAAFFRSPEGMLWRTFTRLPEFGTVERCAEKNPGGPYFFSLSGTTLRGGREPFRARPRARTE